MGSLRIQHLVYRPFHSSTQLSAFMNQKRCSTSELTGIDYGTMLLGDWNSPTIDMWASKTIKR